VSETSAETINAQRQRQEIVGQEEAFASALTGGTGGFVVSFICGVPVWQKYEAKTSCGPRSSINPELDSN
jgi:hypothetical protein